MKKINIILLTIIGLVSFAACRNELVPEVPVLNVFDEQNETVLSLGQSMTYEASYSYYQYLDISSPDLTNEKMPSPKFLVQSNLDWKLVPSENYSWVHPFPEEGSKDGLFYFVIDRSVDQNESRMAEYCIVANDGVSEITVGGTIRVIQDPSDEFFRKSAARLEFAKSSSSKNLYLTTNVPWEYSIEPDGDYATEELDWISVEKKASESGMVDTLRFTVAENESSIRGARIKFHYELGGSINEEIFSVIQNGESVEVEGFPIRWKIGVADHGFVESWPAEGVIEAYEGNGQIRYVSIDKSELDVSKVFKLDINSNDPRALGVWPGDYCEFTSPIPVSKGTILKISFEPRVSASCHKYWRLEYRDGDHWKTAGTPLSTSEPGEEVMYTLAFAGGANASANAQVSTVVKYENSTDRVDFRLLCVANWTCNGTPLEAPNGASWRLTLTDRTSDAWWPTIQCIAGGSEPIVSANLDVLGIKDNLIVFEGNPSEQASFKVLSDQPFTVSADVPWLSFSPEEGPAGVQTEIFASCAQNETPRSRQATIDIKSGITHRYINVVQSSAGAELHPFISVVEGNTRTVRTPAGSFEVEIQGNVPVEVESSDWITVTRIPETKAMVDVTSWLVSYQKNESGESRVGNIRFYNREYSLETVLTLNQVALEVTIDKTEALLFPGETDATFHIVSNVPISAEVSEGTAVIPNQLPETGTGDLLVIFEGETEAIIRLFNIENDYESFVKVRRYSVLGEWKFGSSGASAVKASWNSSESELQGIGTGGKYVADNISEHNLLEYYNSVEKSDATLSAKYKFSRATANNGDPYVKSPFAGDYWLYTVVPSREIPANTKIHFRFLMRNSGAGNRYWLVEYLDGSEWKPALDVLDGMAGTESIRYNFDLVKDSVYVPCEGTFTVSSATSKIQLRVTAVANWTIKGAAFSALNGSTSRMGADGNSAQSHVFEIVL